MSDHRRCVPLAELIHPHSEAAIHTTAATDAIGRHVEISCGDTVGTSRAPDESRHLPPAAHTSDHQDDRTAQLRPNATGSARRTGTGDYDLAIVGSGAAAFAAAITAREQDARVVMIERGAIGGTCVNVGCVPSKALLRAAEVYHTAGHHPFHGIETRAGNIDIGQTVAQKDILVDQLRRQKYASLVDEYGWELVHGEARFLDQVSLAVGDRTIRAQRFFVATGADPAVPPIPGLAEAGYLTSTETLALTRVPRSLVIIGAGYIALELGQLMRRLGSAVTLLQRGKRLLPGYEPEVGQAIRAMLDREDIRVLTGVDVQRVEHFDAGRRLVLTADGASQVLEAEQILVAAGRRPNVQALHLPAAGIEADQRGAIIVDTRLRTTNPAVFAAGDVTLSPQYVYVAARQGSLAAENALIGADKPCDLTALPGVIFTDPQAATVGLTEEQARRGGFDVKTAVLPIDAVPRAQINYDEIGIFKLVADAATDRLLGAHIVADNAGDVIYAATLAVKHRLTVSDLAASFAPYLTMAEGLKLGAVAFGRDITKLSCCAA